MLPGWQTRAKYTVTPETSGWSANRWRPSFQHTTDQVSEETWGGCENTDGCSGSTFKVWVFFFPNCSDPGQIRHTFSPWPHRMNGKCFGNPQWMIGSYLNAALQLTFWTFKAVKYVVVGILVSYWKLPKWVAKGFHNYWVGTWHLFLPILSDFRVKWMRLYRLYIITAP